jgi:hypothetical protein
MGSAIIKVVLVCSIETSCSLILSLTARYFMSICLVMLPLLLFLEKKIVAKLSQ